MANLKPGNPAPKSGQYEVIGPRGGHTGVEVTVPKGTTMPPPPQGGKGKSYEMADPTNNKSGK